MDFDFCIGQDVPLGILILAFDIHDNRFASVGEPLKLKGGAVFFHVAQQIGFSGDGFCFFDFLCWWGGASEQKRDQAEIAFSNLIQLNFAERPLSTRKPESRLVGWLAGWLVGWLAGWLVGWLAGWLVGWLAGWLVGWLAGWLVGWLAGWLVGWLAGWLVGWLDGWMVDCGLAWENRRMGSPDPSLEAYPPSFSIESMTSCVGPGYQSKILKFSCMGPGSRILALFPLFDHFRQGLIGAV